MVTKLTMNDNFFSSIETEQQAYWLGFIYADGHVAQNKPWFVIVQSADHDHVYKLAEAVEYSGEVKIVEKGGGFQGSRPNARLVLCRKKMCDDLNRIGRNNEVMSIPDIPEELIPHFIRGYFDGDGSIHPSQSSAKLADGTRKPYVYLHVQIIGTVPFLKEIEAHFNQQGITTSWKKSKTDYMKYLCVDGGNNLRRLHKYMYDNSTVSLTRKELKWQALYSPNGEKSLLKTPNMLETPESLQYQSVTI